MSESEKQNKVAETPKIVEVIPILKGLPKPALTYFYRGDLREGEFVNIEVRNIPTVGLVSKVRDAREAKTQLRTSSFTLKKLGGKRTNLGISKYLTLAAERTASYYSANTGAILGTLIPKLFLTETDLLCFGGEEPLRTPREPVLIQLEFGERYATYKSIIRENFAKKQSVMFVLPTNELARRAFDHLSTGIEDYTHLFSLEDKKKVIRDTLKAAEKDTHPILFITTPSGLVFNRPDLATIILDAENSGAYRTRAKPYFSFKTLIEFYSRVSGKELVMGDSSLSIETLHKEKTGVYMEFTPLKWRLSFPSSVSLIDMKEYRKDSGNFEILSQELKELVETAINADEQIFLFGARKGLSPSTVCGDCGALLPCKNCGAPVVLHKADKNSRIYVCHACSAVRSAETKCDNCGSWKLTPLGIGIDKIIDEVQSIWPEVPVYAFDKDHLETTTQAKQLAKKISGAGGAIIVGTELFTLYRESIPYTGIVSMDSLFAIPDFSIHERIFSLVTKIREMTEKSLIIQTRNIGKDILTQAAKGDILGFYRSEIEDRESFAYPPFSIFIKVSIELTEAGVNKEAFKLKNLFSVWNPEFIKIHGKKTGQAVLTMIIRRPRDSWPEKDLRDKLSLLGPDFLVKVDPENIL
jgi:primosomal protein N' (replication factor Y)